MDTPKIYCQYSLIEKTEKLVGHPQNPNKHSDEQIDKLIKIIRINGWRSPIVISKRSHYVIKGHGRLAAAIKAGWDSVPIQEQEYGSEADEYNDMIADNRISEFSKLDMAKVGDILELLGTNVNMDALGLEPVDLEKVADEALKEEEKEDEQKTCPHCGGEL